MALAHWPSNLPLMVLGDATLQGGKGLMASHFEHGAALNLSPGASGLLVGRLLLDEAQVLTFNQFVQALNDGQNWFLMPVESGEGMSDHRVRFVLPMAEVMQTTGNSYQVSVALDVYRPAVLDADTYGVIAMYELTDLEQAAGLLGGFYP